MKMSDIRVKVDSKHFQLYNDLSDAAGDAHELFFAAACVGYKLRRKVASSKKEEKFYSRTFSTEEWACIYAMAYADAGHDILALQDDRKVLQLMEEYATAGLEYLIESLFSEFQDDSGLHLDKKTVREAPRHLLYQIWSLSSGA